MNSMVPVLDDKTETLAVRVVSAEQVAWFDAQLDEHHYLGAGRAVGDYLRQIVFLRGQPAALLVWGPACYALKDRDLWIGWSANQRVERLKLIVQNRRFLVLADKGAEPNLASQTMGAALCSLPAQWAKQFGYRPLLAGSFTDPEAYSGTCYKASNWQAVGMSAGYSRHRADFYVANEHPKKLWLYGLDPQARKHLRCAVLPAGCQRAQIAPPGGVLPVSQLQLESLLEVLRRAPDPQGKNTHLRMGPVLSIVALALLAGRREIAEIDRFAKTISQDQRRALCLPRKKGAKAFWQVPSYSVFYQVLTRMDPEAFASLLTDWLHAQASALPQTPALDNKTVTADALHCQKPVASTIMAKGSEYLMQIKANQPSLLKQARACDAIAGPPFFDQTSSGHGRTEQRRLRIFPIEPSSAGFAGARGIVVVRSEVYTKKPTEPPRTPGTISPVRSRRSAPGSNGSN